MGQGGFPLQRCFIAPWRLDGKEGASGTSWNHIVPCPDMIGNTVRMRESRQGDNTRKMNSHKHARSLFVHPLSLPESSSLSLTYTPIITLSRPPATQPSIPSTHRHPLARCHHYTTIMTTIHHLPHNDTRKIMFPGIGCLFYFMTLARHWTTRLPKPVPPYRARKPRESNPPRLSAKTP